MHREEIGRLAKEARGWASLQDAALSASPAWLFLWSNSVMCANACCMRPFRAAPQVSRFRCPEAPSAAEALALREFVERRLDPFLGALTDERQVVRMSCPDWPEAKARRRRGALLRLLLRPSIHQRRCCTSA